MAGCVAEDDLEPVEETSSALLVAKSMPCGANTIGYLQHLPSDYASSGSARYPAMIFLHGIGERGSGSAADLELLKKHGPPKHIQNGHTMTFTVDGKTEKFIVISPQLATSYGSYPRSWLTCVVDYTLANYRVDPDRLYVTGLSLGGNGTYLAATSTTLAPKIAAAAPIAGWGPTSEACVIANNEIPIWAFHGDADSTVDISKDQAMINAINACQPPPSPAPIFTIYAGVGHNSWDRAYNTGNTYHDPNLYEWLLRQRRGTTRQVRVDLGAAGTTTAGYNNLTGQAGARNSQIANLVDTTAVSTGITLNVSGFNDVNTNGTQTPSATLALPASATNDSFFGNTVVFNSYVAPEAKVVLSNLDPARHYELNFFASRTSVSDNRETQYDVVGNGSQTVVLQVANNTASRAVALGVRPGSDGKITVTVKPGPNNDNANGFFYLGALELVWSE
jgi:dienelactone hydrolase